MSILSTWPDGTDPFRERSDAHSGLDFAYGAGRVRDDNTVTDVAAGTVTLTDATTNYVEVTGAGSVSANTTGFTSGRIPLYTVVTSGGAITTVTDKRAFLDIPGAGGGGTSLPNLFVGTAPYWAARANQALTANRCQYMKVLVNADVTVDTVRWRNAGTASGNMDIAIYNEALDTRLGETGSFAVPAAGDNSRALASSVALSAGTAYYVGFVASSSTPEFTIANIGTAMQITTGWEIVGRQESTFPLPASPTVAGWDDIATYPVVYLQPAP